VAYCAAGGIVLFSGIKGASISDTVKAVLKGDLTVTPTQTINTSAPAGSTGSSGASGGVANVTPPGSVSPANIPVSSSAGSVSPQAVLAAIGAPATAANIASVSNWFAHEGTTAQNNPMATTQNAAGATQFNSAGVKNYPSAAEGITATAQTLENGLYPAIVMALRSGQGLSAGNSQVQQELLTWSGGGYSSV